MRYSDGFGFNGSKLLLGTAYFGSNISESESFEILDKFYELGGTHIDTARLYADGNAEKVICNWVRSRKPKNIHISTKGGYSVTDSPIVPRLSEKELRYDVELSLKALGTECIDFYWLHCDDEARSEEEIIDTLNKFVKEGKIKRFGASNWKHARVKRANDYAKNNGLKSFEAAQIRFSPAVVVGDAEREAVLVNMGKEAFDFYASENMPVAAYASQAKGFFSKLDKHGVDGLSPKAKERYLCKENIEKFEYIKQVAKRRQCSIAAVVCSALCSLEAPNVFPITGASRPEQLDDSAKGADVVLEKYELEVIFKECMG